MSVCMCARAHARVCVLDGCVSYLCHVVLSALYLSNLIYYCFCEYAVLPKTVCWSSREGHPTAQSGTEQAI